MKVLQAEPLRDALQERDTDKISQEMVSIFPRYTIRRARRLLENVKNGTWETLSLDQADEIAILLDRSLESFYREEDELVVQTQD